MHVTVLGAGYVGLVTAASLASNGHTVRLLEIDPARLGALRAGETPFHEPGIGELTAEGVRAQRLLPTGDPGEALAEAELALICVGTPLGPGGEADLSQVVSACGMVAEHAPTAAVAIRSTLPLGSRSQLAGWLRRPSLESVVTNPEFLRQGTAVADFRAPTRVVMGTPDGTPTAASDLLLELYGTTSAPVLVTDYESAEVIKNAANAFLAAKLSFINEVADLCEVYGADVEDVVAGIGMDPRIGKTYLRPGIGFGGSCLPKELANMVRVGRSRGLEMPLMAGAARTNEERPRRIAERLARAIGTLQNKRVAVLGLAFKPDTDDTRYSPALALIDALVALGARVIAHDPAVRSGIGPERRFARADSAAAAIEGADLVILATEWPEYLNLDWATLARSAPDAVLYDGRNALRRDELSAAGWAVLAVGRGP